VAGFQLQQWSAFPKATKDYIHVLATGRFTGSTYRRSLFTDIGRRDTRLLTHNTTRQEYDGSDNLMIVNPVLRFPHARWCAIYVVSYYVGASSRAPRGPPDRSPREGTAPTIVARHTSDRIKQGDGFSQVHQSMSVPQTMAFAGITNKTESTRAASRLYTLPAA